MHFQLFHDPVPVDFHGFDTDIQRDSGRPDKNQNSDGARAPPEDLAHFC